jgi:RES domain-containing protein
LPDPRPSPGKIAKNLPSKPFSGEAYRHVYEGKDGTDSSRSKITGGRWNPRREFEALYLALSEEGAVG